MKLLFDTNICIYLIKEKPPEVLRRFGEHTVGDIGLSSITAAELHFGAQKSQHPEGNLRALEQFLLPLTVLPFDQDAAVTYGHVRTFLERRGMPIGSLDTLIAAHALSLNLALVTNKVGEFERVPDLKVENWVDA